MTKQTEINIDMMVQELKTFFEKNGKDARICIIFGLVIDKDGDYKIFESEQEDKNSYLSAWHIMEAIGPLEERLESKMFNAIRERNVDIRQADYELQLESYRNFLKKWI